MFKSQRCTIFESAAGIALVTICILRILSQLRTKIFTMRAHEIFSKQHSSIVPHGNLLFVRKWDLHSTLIRDCLLMGKNTVEAKQWLDKRYGDSAPGKSTIIQWYGEFKCCRTNTDDAERSSHPKSAVVRKT